MTTSSQRSNKPSKVEPKLSKPHAPLTTGDVRNIFYGLMLGMFLSALNQTIVATALPTIGRDFGDFENLSWVIIAYLLARVGPGNGPPPRDAQRWPWARAAARSHDRASRRQTPRSHSLSRCTRDAPFRAARRPPCPTRPR
jgi:hypothetical protein